MAAGYRKPVKMLCYSVVNEPSAKGIACNRKITEIKDRRKVAGSNGEDASIGSIDKQRPLDSCSGAMN